MKKSGMQFRTPGQTIVATDFRLPGRNEQFVGKNGELNASSKKDLIATIAQALNHVANSGSEMVTEDEAQRRSETAAVRREMVQAAFDSDEGYRELGQVLANELYISANKQGFARRILKRQDLTQGQIPHALLRMKNVMAVIAGSPTRVETQLVRDNWHYPPEFYISGRPFIEKRDIDRSNTDTLEEKYIEGLEAIMVGEDRVWRNLALKTDGVDNEPTTVVGSLSPTSLSSIRNQVTRWQIPATTCLLASDLWQDIIGNAGFQAIIDPVSKHELLMTGYLGTVLGMTMMTDGFRHFTHHVLEEGEIWVLGDGEYHGQYTDRGGIESQPLDGAQENIPGRGWFMYESISMVITNARSVARGTRVAS